MLLFRIREDQKFITLYKPGFWLAGLAATFIGNGIGRFAYITLMPALIQANWFSKEDAAQLGVATLIGYLLGPIFIQRVIKRISNTILVGCGMVLCSLSYLACSFPNMSFLWFYGWRFLAGFGGAILMVLAAPMILPHVPTAQRGRVAGVIFSGIGLGAAASGLLIPLMVNINVVFAWLTMGISCSLLSFMTWKTWADISVESTVSTYVNHSHMGDTAVNLWRNHSMWYLLIAYAFNAVGFLPHTLFWVDFMVRELGFSLAVGGVSWSLFGIGAALGPLLTGILGDRWGFRRSLLVCFALKAFGVALPLITTTLWVLHFSAFLVGMFTPGIVTLVSMYALELVGAKQHRFVWSTMTFSFALTQAFGGFCMALLISHADSYLPLYAISATALVISILCIMATHPEDSPQLKQNT
ncbi:YbfB/YjiJ family MFS transporter [Iningainema tapete]|uniref:YbfB/YjiJ family MFS transporter n=1 Tax=Iningainema tapete BLCC-T55 TaxID=2748662 RepID=A0A8J6XTB1_9CYAN|nr:YbfB/YjiJ family MFS transporter [Iningainema tapete]MBD2777895.1 YbfB/YjiJ family MFS transporter [Iningainema tapete BLCC-T55]